MPSTNKELNQIISVRVKQLAPHLTYKHLDIPENHFNDLSLSMAATELSKMSAPANKTPLQKMVCLFNCCHIIFHMLNLSR